MFVEAAGGVLVGGGLACVASAVAGRRSWLVASLFAAALMCASVDAFGGARRGTRPPVRWASRVRWRWCSSGSGGRNALSWLDFVMGGCAVGALSAPPPGRSSAATLGASGVAAALGLARWRVSVSLAVALIGLIALGELPWLAAVPLAVAVRLREPPATPTPVFNPIVLAALLAYAAAAMVLLVVGQFVLTPG